MSVIILTKRLLCQIQLYTRLYQQLCDIDGVAISVFSVACYLDLSET